MQVLKVGIVGDFERRKHSHWATEAALFHAAARLGLAVQPHWVGTAAIEAKGCAALLTHFDGIWGAPGSPYASMAGMLAAIEHARVKDVPYLGTCGGFQYALIELSRNVLGVLDADSAENDATGKTIVITPISCPAASQLPLLNGAGVARPEPGTLLAELCGSDDLRSEYFCSFETNAEFVSRWQAAGLRVSARGADGELRAFELPSRRFFVATLFQPQLSSSYESPHPLILGYLSACARGARAPAAAG